MRSIRDNPIGQVVILIALYVMSTGGLMFANERYAPPTEAPWTWLWALWGALFAPAVLATVFGAVWSAPSWRRLKVLYGASLAAILAAMEVLWLRNAHMWTGILVVCGLSVLIPVSFRTFQGAPE